MAQRGPTFIPSRNEMIVSRRMQNNRLPNMQDYCCAVCRYQVFLIQFVCIGKVDDIIPKTENRILDPANFTATVCLRDVGSRNVFYFDAGTSQYKRFNRELVDPYLQPYYSNDTNSGEPVFPICHHCFFVLRHFLQDRQTHRQSSAIRPIVSLDILYEGLRRQFLRDQQDGCDSRAFSLGWEHEAFTVGMALSHTELNQHPEYWWMAANPAQPIPSLPSYFLSFLKLTSDDDQRYDENSYEGGASVQSVRRNVQLSPFLRLPAELILEIASHLDFGSVFALRQTCLYMARSVVLNQHFWFKQLTEGNLFGFLFTFETVDATAEIRTKALRRRLMPPKWDWATLVAQLAKYSSFENEGLFHDAPPGFRNRRRIWRILETIETSG